MFKTLRGLAPPYLSDECLTPVAAYDHATRSVHIHACCAVDQTRLGDRSFAVVGLLPAWLRLMDNYTRFRRLLKAHLFHWGCGAYSDCFRRRVWIFLLLTYLLYRYVINPVISSPPPQLAPSFLITEPPLFKRIASARRVSEWNIQSSAKCRPLLIENSDRDLVGRQIRQRSSGLSSPGP